MAVSMYEQALEGYVSRIREYTLADLQEIALAYNEIWESEYADFSDFSDRLDLINFAGDRKMGELEGQTDKDIADFYADDILRYRASYPNSVVSED